MYPKVAVDNKRNTDPLVLTEGQSRVFVPDYNVIALYAINPNHKYCSGTYYVYTPQKVINKLPIQILKLSSTKTKKTDGFYIRRPTPLSILKGLGWKKGQKREVSIPTNRFKQLQIFKGKRTYMRTFNISLESTKDYLYRTQNINVMIRNNKKALRKEEKKI